MRGARDSTVKHKHNTTKRQQRASRPAISTAASPPNTTLPTCGTHGDVRLVVTQRERGQRHGELGLLDDDARARSPVHAQQLPAQAEGRALRLKEAGLRETAPLGGLLGEDLPPHTCPSTPSSCLPLMFVCSCVCVCSCFVSTLLCLCAACLHGCALRLKEAGQAARGSTPLRAWFMLPHPAGEAKSRLHHSPVLQLGRIRGLAHPRSSHNPLTSAALPPLQPCGV